PAVLWEQTGDAVELTSPVIAPDWRSAEPTGEALWPTPPGAPRATAPSDGPDDGPDDGSVSFT
ncbi:MAG: D-alanyl-D-alanine carboxypeptidase, partial [Acidimicrobiia bacterium]